VVGVAEQHQIGQVGAPAEQPVPHVVGVQAFDAGLGAPGSGAAAVAAQQRPSLRGGRTALAPTYGQGLVTLFEHDDGGGFAEHAARLRARDRRTALEVGAPRGGVVGENSGVDVHDDLASGRIAGAAVEVHAGVGQ